jgi:NADH:ubiquinone oxidoreductase subunit C
VENEQLVEHLLEKFPEKAEKVELNPAQAAVKIDPSVLLDMVAFIKEDENIAIDYLSSVSAIDYLEDGMEMVYHFTSIKHCHILTLKVKLDREKPEVPTIIEFFPASNWYEREAWELFGINILNHPNLKTLLLPEDWDQGWPMRRDWDEGKDFIKMPEF